MKTPKRPVTLMLVAQIICLLAVPLTLCCGLVSVSSAASYITQADYVNYDNTLLVAIMTGAQALRDFALGGLLIWVELEAFCVCGRVRKSSAFSAKNEKALGRVALALCLAGIVTLLFGENIVPFLLAGLPAISPVVERLLLPFTLLTLALMVRAVQVLMHRALEMQEESDLTV